jgi:putative DNA primase/helicase
MTSKALATALLFAEKGIHCFPQDRSKRPCIKDWPHKASCDPAELKRWGESFPTANFAAVTGSLSRLVVLDIDVKNGQPGVESYHRLMQEVILPKTLTVRTPSGGMHCYFSLPDGAEVHNSNSHGLPGFPGIECKGDGGCVTVPGSMYSSGAEYVLVDAVDPAMLPAALLALLRNGNGKKAVQTTQTCIEKGARNSTLTARAGKLRRDGADAEALLADLRKLNEEKCSPPLPDSEVAAIAESVARYQPAQQLALTDMGNGYQFIRDHGPDLRFCTKWDTWLHFDGTRWSRDDALVVHALAKKTVRALYDAAFPAMDKALAKHAITSSSASKIRAMLEMARSVEGVQVDPADLDADQWLLNCSNGTVDLRTGQLRPHRKEDLLTKMAGVAFDPSAECPRWRLFIDEVMDGQADMIAFLQKLMGYCLTGDMREDAYFVYWGKGCNGKSVCVETEEAVMGDYASAAAEQTFLMNRGERINADLARISDKRLVFTSEIGRGQKLNESLIKRWTSQDTVTVEAKYMTPWDVKPVGKLIFRTNYKPRILGQDDGIWRRTKLVPFTQDFQGREDRKLGEKLLVEGSGILNWLLEGCRLWQAEGLTPPAAVRAASAVYRTEQDMLDEFFSKHLEKGDRTFTVTKARAYDLYKAHAEETGERVLGKRDFGALLSEYPGIEDARTNVSHVWTGIREVRPEEFRSDK